MEAGKRGTGLRDTNRLRYRKGAEFTCKGRKTLYRGGRKTRKVRDTAFTEFECLFHNLLAPLRFPMVSSSIPVLPVPPTAADVRGQGLPGEGVPGQREDGQEAQEPEQDDAQGVPGRPQRGRGAELSVPAGVQVNTDEVLTKKGEKMCLQQLLFSYILHLKQIKFE